MKKRIGILTSGGDCPGLNAAIRGAARAAYEMFDAEIVGIHDGYRGLIEGDYSEMSRSHSDPGRHDSRHQPDAFPQHAENRIRQRGQGRRHEEDL